MNPNLLKNKHTLIGKSLIPVVHTGGELKAKLKKDHELGEYSIEDLKKAFNGLTGKSAGDVLSLTGRVEEKE